MLILATLARTLAQESDRWFLWLPVVFAAALITGERSGIMDETNQAMRHSTSSAEARGRRLWVTERTVVRTAPPTSPAQNDEEDGANPRLNPED